MCVYSVCEGLGRGVHVQRVGGGRERERERGRFWFELAEEENGGEGVPWEGEGMEGYVGLRDGWADGEGRKGEEWGVLMVCWGGGPCFCGV